MERLTERKKGIFKELNDYLCETCHKVFKPERLCIHRIKRGNMGGTYHWRNCMVLCHSCHHKFHYKEFK